MEPNSTKYMKKYMEEIFGIVIELYKSSMPELLCEAFHVGMEDVKNMNTQTALEMLNNLTIDYKTVLDEKSRQIWYSTPIGKKNTVLQYMGRSEEHQPDVLHIYLVDDGILDKDSVEEIKQSRTNTGMSKVLDDIDYIAHEIGHALDSRIIIQNPSLVDAICYSATLSEQSLKNGLNLDTGEAFAISMEKIILDELKKPGQLEKFGLSDYNINDSDIDELWSKKRVKKWNTRIIGNTSEDKPVKLLDFAMIPYKIYSNNGINTLIDYIKTVNLYSIQSSIPDKRDTMGVIETCDIIKNKKYDAFLITDPKEYKPIYSTEEIIEIFNKTFFHGELTQEEKGENLKLQDKANLPITENFDGAVEEIAGSRLLRDIKKTTRGVKTKLY